jgi:hypothetical protein
MVGGLENVDLAEMTLEGRMHKREPNSARVNVPRADSKAAVRAVRAAPREDVLTIAQVNLHKVLGGLQLPTKRCLPRYVGRSVLLQGARQIEAAGNGTCRPRSAPQARQGRPLERCLGSRHRRSTGCETGQFGDAHATPARARHSKRIVDDLESSGLTQGQSFGLMPWGVGYPAFFAL